ncbi:MULTISPECIES: cold-shock protein [Paenibacillus]|uniref:cold-shock protein n=1 Tax=Paenibacillus TaxID=44249 RepID=UPI0022B92BD0|nr:cold-shock protein [Paenibacillus caseinilyticus]MCZ8520938.1 cold-shock protein [Paenibacillus caseinilyticus]
MYNKRIPLEDLPHTETKIWTCSQDGCKGWTRDNFTFEHAPVCHLCHSVMISSVKLLPLVANSNKEMKSRNKGIMIG